MPVRIGLISDTHIPEARHELWPQAFAALKGADVILHAGDIYDLRIIDELGKIAPVYAARGNGDDGSGGRPVQPHDDRLRDAWTLEIGGIAIGMTHTLFPPAFEATLARLFPDRRPDVLVFGDTHVEEIQTIEGVLCVNPGSPTLPHNLRTELGTIGFLEIDGGEPTASIWQLASGGIEPFDWARWPSRG